MLLAFEAQLAVGVVLEDQGVVLVGQGDQLLAATTRHGRPRGILEVHDGIDELAALALAPKLLQLLSRHLGDHALVVHGHIEHASPVAADGGQRARESRRLGEDGVAHVHESAEGQRQRMTRAVGHDHIIRRDLEVLEEPVLVADQLAQALVAEGLAVGESGRALRLHDVRGSLDHSLVGERAGVGVARPELEKRLGHRPGRWKRGAPADAGAGGQHVVEAGVR